MDKEKRKLFGTKDQLPGQSLMTAVLGVPQPIGIPPYRYNEVLLIMNEVLSDKEYFITVHGLGFKTEKLAQKEIASLMGITEPQVSAIARQAINKLKASPNKVKLKKLVPTAEELFDLIVELEETVRQQGDDLKAMQHLCNIKDHTIMDYSLKLKKATRDKSAAEESKKAAIERELAIEKEKSAQLRDVIKSQIIGFVSILDKMNEEAPSTVTTSVAK